MNNQNGYHLTKWEIKQRLLKANIPFNSAIQAKDYYIALFNKELCDNQISNGNNDFSSENQRQLANNITIIDDRAMRNASNIHKVRQKLIENYNTVDDNGEKMKLKHNGDISGQSNNCKRVNGNQMNNDDKEQIVFTKPPFNKQNQTMRIDHNGHNTAIFIKRGSVYLGLGGIAILLTLNLKYITDAFNIETINVNSIRNNAQIAISNIQSIGSNVFDYLSRINLNDIIFFSIVILSTIVLMVLINYSFEKKKKIV